MEIKGLHPKTDFAFSQLSTDAGTSHERFGKRVIWGMTPNSAIMMASNSLMLIPIPLLALKVPVNGDVAAA